jgi:EmrB/QacA subfamily drug resistance transporter
MSHSIEELAHPEPPRPATAVSSEVGTTAPHREAGGRDLAVALVIISMAQLMVVLDATIVNIALPHIQLDLGFSQANLSWVVNAYTLAFGSLLLLGGRAGDLLGRRKVFIAGVVLFALASLIGGLAQDQTILISARVLQGLGAAMASPTALSLITTTFPAGPARNRAFAVYAAMSGAGAAVGLILGGALTEASWRWTFFINVPIGLAVLVLAPRFLAESARQSGRFDLPGALTATAGLGGVVYGLTHAATDGWSNGVTVAFLIAGTALLAAFLAIEARSPHALMPFRILAQRDRATTYVVMLAVGASLFSMFYFLGIYIQEVLGYSSLRAGVAFLPFSAGIVVAAQLASFLVNRTDPRWVAGTGGLFAAGGMWWMAQLTPSSGYVSGLLGPIVTLSFGMGLIFVPLTLTAVSRVRHEDSGVASAVLNTMQQIGGALGLATLSTVATTAATDRGAALGAALQQKLASGRVLAQDLPALRLAIQHDAFTHGATSAFTVGSLMVLAATAITLLFLRVGHRELATDTVHLGPA